MMLHENDLPKVVVPITEHVDAPLPLLGSGCFFRRKDRVFLVTATHVIEDMPSAPKQIMVPKAPGAKSELWTIGGGLLTSTPKEKEDVAIYRLENTSMISDVLNGGWRVLTDDDIERGPLSHAMICGWPHARLRPVDGGLKAVLLAYNVRAIAAPHHVAPVRPTDVFLSWPVNTEEPVPKLDGISGSPIWSRRGDELRLAGVQHSVCRDEYVRGTHWGVADYAISSRM